MNHNNWEYLFKLGQVLFKDVTNASNHTYELILCNIIAIQCQALAMWTSEADPMFVSHINSNGDAMYFKNALLYLAHGNHQDYFNKMSDLIQFFQTRAQDKEDKPYVREMYHDVLPQLQYLLVEVKQTIDSANSCCLSLMDLIPANIPYDDYMKAMNVERNEDGTLEINSSWQDKDPAKVQQYIDAHNKYSQGKAITLLINNATDKELADSLYNNLVIYQGIKQMQKLGLFPKIVADRVAEFLKLYDILSVMKDLGSSQENEMLQLKEQHPLKELKIDTGDEATDDLIKHILSLDAVEVNDMLNLTLPVGEVGINIDEIEEYLY